MGGGVDVRPGVGIDGDELLCIAHLLHRVGLLNRWGETSWVDGHSFSDWMREVEDSYHTSSLPSEEGTKSREPPLGCGSLVPSPWTGLLCLQARESLNTSRSHGLPDIGHVVPVSGP